MGLSGSLVAGGGVVVVTELAADVIVHPGRDALVDGVVELVLGQGLGRRLGSGHPGRRRLSWLCDRRLLFHWLVGDTIDVDKARGPTEA